MTALVRYVKFETAKKLFIILKFFDTIRNQNYGFPLVRELSERVHTRQKVSISDMRDLFRKKLNVHLPRMIRIKAS